MKASVFVGASVDGFIARKNGEVDFLPSDGGEEHGFEEFYNSVDALLMGRKTYDFVLNYDKWFYGKKPVFVLTNRRAELPLAKEAVVKFLRGDPKEVALILERHGV